MFKLPIRSVLQIVGLSVIALFLTTASPNAAPAFDECDEQYEACVEKCGTVSYVYGYFWDGQNWTWGIHPVWSENIDYFECMPGSGHGICQCTY